MPGREVASPAMPLHPQLQPLVDLVNAAAADAPSSEDTTPEMRREAYHGLVAFVPPGPEMDVVDQTIAGPAGEIPIRVYTPTTKQSDSGGVLVHYHGGGWCIGDLDTHDEVCRQLAEQSGSVVVSVGYRLAPEAVFPAAVDDCWAGLQWSIDNANDLVGDQDRQVKIAVVGDSAGGNLSAVIALMARDAGITLAAQLLVYPAVDFRDPSIYPSHAENAEGYILTREGMDWFEANYQPDTADWRASAIAAESHVGLAPAVIITAEFDPLRDEGAAYAAKLEDAGVPVDFHHYEGMVHMFFQLGPLVEPGAHAVTLIANAAKTALA